MSRFCPFVLATLCLGSTMVGTLAGCGQAGPAELLFEANTPELPSEEMMDRTRDAVARRLAMLGVPGVRVEREGAKCILVRLDNREDAGPVRALLDRRGRLEFRMVDPTVTLAQIRSGEPTLSHQILSGPQGRIAVERRAIVTGEMIADARQGFNNNAEPAVTIQFDEAGARRFARVTRDKVGQLFAIVIDGEVIAAPVINEPILGGSAQIAGNFTVETANQLAIALRSGALPVDLEVVEERPQR